MFNKMDRKNTIIISALMVIVGVLMLTILDDYFEKYDFEIAQMIAGFLFGLGFSKLYGIFIHTKQEKVATK